MQIAECRIAAPRSLRDRATMGLEQLATSNSVWAE